MNTPAKLGVYVVGLAVVFGGAAAIGNLTSSPGAAAETSKQADGGHGGHGKDAVAAHKTSSEAPHVPGGLQVSQDGYTLVPQATTVTPDKQTEFRFTVTGQDGRPVTRYVPLHGKKLHLIVARRDLSGFQHLHPAEVGGGVWSVPLTLPEAGVYRVFTDVQPQGAGKQLTLGTDVSAAGDYRPEALPKAEQIARTGDYEVKLTGALEPGKTSKLTLSVSRDGIPVTDLQPYLEAYGHLVALRAGDLAYLHVHPDGAPGDGKTKPGPDITFYAEVPSSGAYRLYLDFQHEGKVRTAEFTAVAGAGGSAAPTPQPTAEPSTADGHDTHTH
jgi:hypothetical protein